MNYEPEWLRWARNDIGKRETLGPNDSPWIREILAKLSGMWLLGQPWCGGAVAYWMQRHRYAIPKTWYRAKDWLKWGVRLTEPMVGCVAVFEREGGGHVGLVVGEDYTGRLLVLGGNQSDAVSIAPFDKRRVLGYRWPTEAVEIKPAPLPKYASTATSSRNEA